MWNSTFGYLLHTRSSECYRVNTVCDQSKIIKKLWAKFRYFFFLLKTHLSCCCKLILTIASLAQKLKQSTLEVKHLKFWSSLEDKPSAARCCRIKQILHKESCNITCVCLLREFREEIRRMLLKDTVWLCVIVDDHSRSVLKDVSDGWICSDEARMLAWCEPHEKYSHM